MTAQTLCVKKTLKIRSWFPVQRKQPRSKSIDRSHDPDPRYVKYGFVSDN